jgi:hypothetical protein
MVQETPRIELAADGARRSAGGAPVRHSPMGWAGVLHEYVMPKFPNVVDPTIADWTADPAEQRLWRDIAVTTGHAAQAEHLLSSVTEPDRFDPYAAAQAYALLAIAQELVWLNTMMATPAHRPQDEAQH